MRPKRSAAFSIRNVEFPIDESIPRYWYRGRRAVTLFFDNLSTLFPEGEAFFIRSVKRYQREVNDPQLEAEIRAFSGQEGIHTREHLEYNAMLVRNGHDVAALEEGIRALLAIPELTGPLRDAFRLAATMSLEHWTAMLAHFVLEDDEMLAGAHPVMAALWRWHAAEECEHKAVAFDVYERMGHGYALRAGVHVLGSVIFWLRVVQQQARMMDEAGIATELDEWADLGKFLFVEQRVVQRLLPIWLRYFERDFHPWHIDDSELVARWIRDWETNPVYRRRVKNRQRVRAMHAEATA